MLELRTKCLHPDTDQPYIVSSSGGVDNSPEGAQVRQPDQILVMYNRGLGWLHTRIRGRVQIQAGPRLLRV